MIPAPQAMLFFAIFTIGYFAGVITALAVFPPQVKEIEEQEVDALQPILDLGKDKEFKQKIKEEGVYSYPALTPS